VPPEAKAPESLPQPELRKAGPEAGPEVGKIDGFDRQNLKVTFDLIMVREGSWFFGNNKDVERDGLALHERDLEKLVQDNLASSQAIIAVGTASCEGEFRTQFVLAGERARRALSLAKQTLGDGQEGYILNLGKFKTTRKIKGKWACDRARSARQRPFILLGASTDNPGAHLEEALRNAFSRNPEVLSLTDYLEFKLTSE
jgi:hypothetical protein